MMLLALATLLAYMSSGRRREKAARDRALFLLAKMDSKFCMAVGVSADWGIIRAWLVLADRLHGGDVGRRLLGGAGVPEDRAGCLWRRRGCCLWRRRAAAERWCAGAGRRLHPSRPRWCQIFGASTFSWQGGAPLIIWGGEPRDARKAELLERVQNVGPRTVVEFNGGNESPPSCGEELTPFSKECACLWRQLRGARSGHYNLASTRAAALKRASNSRGPQLPLALAGMMR